MNFTFSEEQEMLRASVSRYLQRDYDFDTRQAIVRSDAGWSTQVWRRLAYMGLLAAPFPEDVGGLGGSVVDVVALGELFGAHLLVEPYVGSVVMVGGALTSAPGQPAAVRWLKRIITGDAIGAFAHEEATGIPAPVRTEATRTASGYTLTGEKKLVLHGASADLLIVSARLGSRPALFAVDRAATPGLVATPFVTIDGRPAAHLRFTAAELPREALLSADAEAAVQDVVTRAVVALAAESVGAMTELLRRTSEYAATREQFGVPIGSFQAVAHRLADMKIATVKARATLLHTTALIEVDRHTPTDVSILKAQVGRLGRQVGEAAIQTHGGVGMTDELPIGHLHKRILAVEAMFGSTDHHLRVVGAGAARGEVTR
jgi:alkylation response protein AidB-like acyl-CoA dehydrogenase